MIPSYLISYDLIKDKDYDKLFAGILKISNGNCTPLKSVWIIGHDGPASAIRDSLKPYLDSDDKLLVVKLTGQGAWTTSLAEKDKVWLKNNL